MIIANPRNPRGIVWIASYPKSGNTWMRIFLYHLVRISEGLPRADNDLQALDRVTGYEARLFSLFTEILGKPLEEATLDEVMGVRMQVQAEIARRAPGLAMLKTHNLMGFFKKQPIINLKVSAGTIYIVRDPRDVVISLADHQGCTIDQAIGIMNRSAFTSVNDDQGAYEMWGSWSEHVKSWTMAPHEAVIVVRYEDMLADPIKEFGAVARHMRQNPTPEQLEEAVNLSTFRELSEQESQGGFRERSARAEKFFRVGRSGQWKETLTPIQVRKLEQAHAERMKFFGYDLEYVEA